MFSIGHIFFILISAVLIAGGLIICCRKQPSMHRLLIACLVVALVSEAVKVLGNMVIVPVVEPVIENGSLVYRETGNFTPYLEAEHYPFELCSYQIFFIIIALVLKNPKWQKRLYALMYTSCIVGAGMAVVLSSAAPGLSSIKDFASSVQVWRTFIYHSMLIVLGVYIGRSEEGGIRFRDVRSTVIIIAILDFATLYVNSMMATPYYSGDNLVGIGNVVNYFSSYNNPLGIPMAGKTQWFIYLGIRLVLALTLITLVNLPLLAKERRNRENAAE